ncbi:PAS domain S-box protein [Heliobacterium undosum]|uniref:histidine kinase n=1 Tax=Heliomicrobium undosum TaxID=121734 RepID=A0A845L7K1_9FIRM|nr:PAS domain-containing sensor histidine kinase [Heliomicrobium undosum]MZP28901.1 PAS domain S-box protein [Heliomicrobium undosum]
MGDSSAKKDYLESMTRYQFLFEHARDIILFVSLDGAILEANKAAEIEYGYTRDELLRFNIRDLRAPQTVDLLNEQMKLAASETGILFETVHRRKDGRCFPVEVSSKIALPGLSPVLLSIIRNISERKQLERQITEKNQQITDYLANLEQTNQDLLIANQLKSQFLANFSHELRTPLNAIVGFADILYQDDFSTCEERRPLIDIIIKNSEQLLLLIHDVFEMAKIDSGESLVKETTVFSLSQLLHEIYQQHVYRIRKKPLAFHVLQPAAEIQIQGDYHQLIKVIGRIIDNAMKYTESGSITVSAVVEPEFAKILIADTGIGIEKENITKLFSKFTQIDGSSTRIQGGTGLGLVIAKAIIEQMGGTIALHSDGLGKGTVVTLALKRAF